MHLRSPHHWEVTRNGDGRFKLEVWDGDKGVVVYFDRWAMGHLITDFKKFIKYEEEEIQRLKLDLGM